MSYELPELPFAYDALEPHISRETVEYHYDKHHRTYVNKLNKLCKGTEFDDMTLEGIIYRSTGSLFNNAAQVWNHNFYWQCVQPRAERRRPPAELLQAVGATFGTFDRFKSKFIETAMSKFASGWTWVLARDGWLDIENTDDADVPHRFDERAILVCDVWEHAYYIDYRNDRETYLKQFWQLINWDFAASRFVATRRAA